MPTAERLQCNKDNVQAFYDLMFNQCRPAEAIERYAGATYPQHNPPTSPTANVVAGLSYIFGATG